MSEVVPIILFITFFTLFVLSVLIASGFLITPVNTHADLQVNIRSKRDFGEVDYSILSHNTNNGSPNQGTIVEDERKFQVRDNNTIECLDHESPLKLTGGVMACADKLCIQNPEHYEINLVENRIQLKPGLIPGLLKRCDPNTLMLVYDNKNEPMYSVTKEYTFPASEAYVEVVLPSHLYTHVWNEETKLFEVKTLSPQSLADLPHELTGGKLRVRCGKYGNLLDFCRFSIHTHSVTPDVICCKRLCSRPEPLTTIELSDIRSVASKEPYYTCSWLEKEVIFKWNVGKQEFEPYWSFDCAVGVYSDIHNKYDTKVLKIFAFNNWKTPDEDVINADSVYFKSPINLAGYKWYEPSEDPFSNVDLEADPKETNHISSVVVAIEIMNLATVPESVILSSTLLRSYTFDMGVELKEYIY